MTEREALKLALEALNHYEKAGLATVKTIDAITAIKEALAQPEREPVAVVNGAYANRIEWKCTPKFFPADGTNLYITPPQRTWVGLTDEEVRQLIYSCDYDEYEELVKATETKLKEKNT